MARCCDPPVGGVWGMWTVRAAVRLDTWVCQTESSAGAWPCVPRSGGCIPRLRCGANDEGRWGGGLSRLQST